jgi:hypothetical protein
MRRRKPSCTRPGAVRPVPGRRRPGLGETLSVGRGRVLLEGCGRACPFGGRVSLGGASPPHVRIGSVSLGICRCLGGVHRPGRAEEARRTIPRTTRGGLRPPGRAEPVRRGAGQPVPEDRSGRASGASTMTTEGGEIDLRFERPMRAADVAPLFAQTDWAAGRAEDDVEQIVSIWIGPRPRRRDRARSPRAAPCRPPRRRPLENQSDDAAGRWNAGGAGSAAAS